MIEGKDLNDGAILQATKVNIDGKGLRQLEIALPDGFVVKSEWMKPEVADKMVVKWCESVRDTFAARLEEKARARKAPSTTAPMTGERSAPAEAQPTSEHTSAPVSPEDLVLREVKQSRQEVEMLTSRVDTYTDLLQRAEERVRKWEQVAKSLNIKLEGEDDATDDTGSTAADDDGTSDGEADDGVADHTEPHE